MNLNMIASRVVRAVNPSQRATLLPSTGYTTNADGSRTPAYGAALSGPVQVQALTGKDIEHLAGLNIQGVQRAVYLSGDWEGVVRPIGAGGDLLKFEGRTWLVEAVLEHWPEWSKLAVTLQAGD